ncbi:Maf family protein [Jannaschia ovalis]|uniref:Nucleoside triphosphate pyrophosphatase n=1 Tax=Jannaschia ovalis TaxID=3038773 RepID=A0ABY8LG57_9RHOB|nr:nucleoside triphosphate pyrophosphatase [Jannaschia sp. GRR-S6-38]WGH80291.1 Maf family protein [Jannaschia sp. GRR-S6-38]
MLTLASRSPIRATLLKNAGIAFEVAPARVDEDAVKDALLEEGLGPRDVADALAELKALRVRAPGLVLGCDQTLSFEGALIGKPASPEAAVAQLAAMGGKRHKLHSAVVIAEDGRPVWRHVADVTMMMRVASEAYLADYVARNWEEIRHCAGGYMLEGEGARLFHRVDGDYFAVLGLPLLPLLDYLITRGEVAI